MHAIVIVAMCVVAACLYGIIHDQITARIAIEYFTIGHYPFFATDSPTVVALGWGILASWWAGLLLGVILAAAARLGSAPAVDVDALVKPIMCLLVVMAIAAVGAGVVGYVLAINGQVAMNPYLSAEVPADVHPRFLANGWAHTASYLVGSVGAIFIAFRVWRSRYRSTI